MPSPDELRAAVSPEMIAPVASRRQFASATKIGSRMRAAPGRGRHDRAQSLQNQSDTTENVTKPTCRCRQFVRGIDSPRHSADSDILKKQSLDKISRRGIEVASDVIERSWSRASDPHRGSEGHAASCANLPDLKFQHPEVLVMTNYISLRAVWHALKERGYWRICAAMSTERPVPVSPNRRCL